MSKLLLSCDDYVYLNGGQYYAATQEKYDFYQRYLRVFDSLKLVCRCEEEPLLKKSRVPLSKNKRIELAPVPIFHGPVEYAKVYFSVGKAIQNAIKGCDAAILRIPSTVAHRVGKMVMRSGMPYACEVVFDAEDAWQGATGLNRFVWKRFDREMRRMCNKAKGVSCVTEKYLQQHYYSTQKDSFTSHYSSLALPVSFYSSPKTALKTKQIIIAHTASPIEFNGRKGHVEVVEALALLKQQGINIKVQFAGNSKLGGIDKIKAFAEDKGLADRVEFVGFLDRNQLSTFLDNADLYVMPTRAEGLPRVIIEAMAKGLPCITTPVSGNPELVDEHFLVPYEDVVTLANRIEELCSNAELYERTSRANFERSQKYEASILESRRDEFYHNLRDRIRK